MRELNEKYKIIVTVILLAVASSLIYYFHVVLKTGIIFTHFFYIPIIVAALWWKKKGLIVAIFLSGLLILSDVIFKMPSYDDIPRIFMFMVIGFIVAELSETIVKSDKLVCERTSELQESEAKYRTLYECSSDAIMLLDEKGFFDCNIATLAMFGFLKKEEFIKAHPSDVSPPYQPDGADSLTAANNKISDAFRKGMNSFEWMHRRKNGEEFPAEVLLTAFQLNGKQVLQATVRDITARKKVEEKLLTEKIFSDTTVDSIPGVFYVLDKERRIIRWNKALEDITGYSAEKLRNMNSLQVIHGDDHERVRNKIKEAFETGFVGMEARLLSRSEARNYLFTGRRMNINQKMYLVGTGIDITERKRAEMEYKTILRTAMESFFVVDMQGHFLDVNDAYCTLTGYNREELLTMRIRDMEVLETPEETIDHIRKIVTLGGDRFETRHRCKDGRIVDIDGSVKYLEFNGGRIFSFFRDITERKLNEKALRDAKEEAEHANKAKTNFLHTMSHELRTPLNAILGFSEMLKQKTAGELNEKQEHFIDNIIKGGNNLHKAISQILEIVKMDEGTLELLTERVPVPETVDEAIGVVKECAEKKNVLIEKKFDPELEYIEADKQKFRQVFINLLDNAVKFSKQEGGTVSINTKKEGDMAKFTVTDRGIGIKEENMEKIFQKFTQLDSGTSRKYGGAGIGLAITKQFIELHGGRIWVESRYGEGCTFIFTIPLKNYRRMNNI